MRSAKRLAVISALLFSTSAYAQELPMLPGEGGGGVDPALAAPYPIETDPSEGVVLDGIDGSLDTLSTTGEQQLDEMTRGVGGGSAPSAPAATESGSNGDYVELPTMGVTGDLEEVTRLRQHQKDILLLETLNEKADLAISLWEKVNNNENAIASRMARQKEASDAARVESERLAREAALSMPSQGAVTAVQMPQASPVVVEVIGSEASILVPDVGMVIARPGDRLPNGMNVVSMGVSGVVVSTPGGPRRTLGFGTSIGGSGAGQQ